MIEGTTHHVKHLSSMRKSDKERALEKRVKELEEAIRTALYGSKLDENNRDDNGLLYYPDLDMITKTLKEALKDG